MADKPLSDEMVVLQVQSGDSDAYAEIVQRYQHRLTAYGRRLLFNHSDIEDIVQEIFIKAYRNLNSFDSSRRFSPWLYRIAHNEFVNHGKKFARQLIDYFDPDRFLPQLRSDENLEHEFDTDDLGVNIDKAVKLLPDKYREPFMLFAIEQMSYQEIADVLRIPTSTVGVRIMRAKKLLQTSLRDHHE